MLQWCSALLQVYWCRKVVVHGAILLEQGIVVAWLWCINIAGLWCITVVYCGCMYVVQLGCGVLPQQLCGVLL